MSADLTLSVVMPVYNERRTLPHILRLVMLALPGTRKQIIIVDDNSTDGSRDWLRQAFPNLSGLIVGIGQNGDGEPIFVQAKDIASATGRQDVETLSALAADTTVSVIFHDKNTGKGGALRTGLSAASGDAIIIQDADLEYDPADWTEMFRLVANGVAVVYGSRFYGRPHRSLYFHHYAGNRAISLLFDILYDQIPTDV